MIAASPALALLAALLCGATPLPMSGYRQDPAPIPDPKRERAAAAFAAGEAAFERGDYEVAAESFALAHELAPHPYALFNLGLAQSLFDRPIEAWYTFERLLFEAQTPEQREDARLQREELRQRLTFLTLIARPHDRVCIDGKPAVTGRSLVLRPGVYTIQSGDLESDVMLEAGQSHQLDLRFTQSSSRSTVTTAVMGTAVGTTALALGLGIGAATADRDQLARGLAGGAATSAGIALLAGTAALLLYRSENPGTHGTEPPGRRHAC